MESSPAQLGFAVHKSILVQKQFAHLTIIFGLGLDSVREGDKMQRRKLQNKTVLHLHATTLSCQMESRPSVVVKHIHPSNFISIRDSPDRGGFIETDLALHSSKLLTMSMWPRDAAAKRGAHPRVFCLFTESWI